MNSKYNPEIHHRRSIRLKGHDYAGGGLYFVTMCAHREFINFASGKPFGAVAGATHVPPVQAREIIEEMLVVAEQKNPFWKWEETVVMPDHFHALVRMEASNRTLGNVMGSFKAAVSKEIRRRGNTCVARIDAQMQIWQRNYYEIIVHGEEMERNIRNYIRMNPWKLVVEFDAGEGAGKGATRVLRGGATHVSPVRLRGIGNPALWNGKKLGVLCSRNAPRPDKIPNAEIYFGGFHSPMEKDILKRLLEMKKPVIWCPAWGIKGAVAGGAPRMAPVRDALQENRMLILEMENVDGNLAAAEERNRFVIEMSEDLWVPYVSPGGMLHRLINEK
jgi:REP element-mobilizing transposase RayT